METLPSRRQQGDPRQHHRALASRPRSRSIQNSTAAIARSMSASAFSATLSPLRKPLPPVNSQVWRPTPVGMKEVADALRVTRDVPLDQVVDEVMAGRSALFVDRFIDVTETRRALNKRFCQLEASMQGIAKGVGKGSGKGISKGRGKQGLKGPANAHGANELRAFRREANRRLLIPTLPKRGVMALRGGPSYIGYLDLLYGAEGTPYAGENKLVFRANDISAMNVAWQFFVNGIQYPFLDHKLHPFFGVYFTPSPYDHFLNLVDWLEARPDILAHSDARALDLGTGCGVVSFILRTCRRGLSIVASDMCPNAILSSKSEFERWGQPNVKVLQSDLFDGFDGEAAFDLIVFNPPWIPERDDVEIADTDMGGDSVDVGVHRGNDYPPDLFDRLFASAPQHLRPGGRLLILFADYAQRRGLTDKSPLERFGSGNAPLQLVDIHRRRVDPGNRSAHRMTRRDKDWALKQDYHVELWEFVKSSSD